ncbi:hypothetical protein PT7_1713 [Pusillimonas sp. T7-7]|nr:hypothetical protein PT7_1713 [Pusillimonas sp. T7-7]
MYQRFGDERAAILAKVPILIRLGIGYQSITLWLRKNMAMALNRPIGISLPF